MPASSSSPSWLTPKKKSICSKDKELDFYYTLGEVSKQRLSDNDVISIIEDQALVNANEMTTIRLYGCISITDKTLIHISKKCPNLQKLGVAQCNVTDDGIKAIINKCPKLIFLSFSQCRNVTDAVLEDLATNCPDLEELHAQWCNIRKLPSSISELKKIRVLHLDYNLIKELPSSITDLKNTCKDFKIGHNPLQKPPLSTAEQGFGAIEKYFVTSQIPLPNNSDGFMKKRGQRLMSDKEKGNDLLDLDVISRVFAEYIASTDLEPPFVLGIFGKWGSGKSFFINLIKKHLINIQKQKVNIKEHQRFVGHMYFVKFDAWTYSKKDLWASLMFRIFNDLSEQLELEQTLQEAKDLKEGGLSVIQLVEELATNEKNYLQKLAQDGVNVDEILNSHTNNGRVSRPFTEVFASQMRKDKEELKEAQKRLAENSNTTVWENIMQNKNGTEMSDMNIFYQAIINKINKATDEEKEKLKSRTLGENFQKEFNFVMRLWIYMKSTPMLSWVAFALILAILIGGSAIWNLSGVKELYAQAGIILGSLGSSIAVLIKWIRSGIEYGSKCAEEFSEQIGQAQSFVSDIEADSSDAQDEGIRKEQKQISQIKGRLSVLEGESMHTVVKNRVNSSLYLDNLGIVHQAQEDLHRLSESMFNKYYEEKSCESDELKSKVKIKFLDAKDSPFTKNSDTTPAANKKRTHTKRKVPVLIFEHEGKEIMIWASNGKQQLKIKGVREIIENKKYEEFSEETIDDGQDLGEGGILWDVRRISVDYENEIATFHSTSDPERKKEVTFDKIRNYIKNSDSIIRNYIKNSPAPICNCCIKNSPPRDSESCEEQQSKSVEIFPRGEPRILLFVDDLDRCEPEAVIRILETLQLLVKSKLFVVVASIDLRYVCRSLETNKYDKILTSQGSPTGMDFLEKIIQIPYNLPMINDNIMNKFVEEQVYLRENSLLAQYSEMDTLTETQEERASQSSLPIDIATETTPLLPPDYGIADINEDSSRNEAPPQNVVRQSTGGNQSLGSEDYQQFSPMEVGILKTACKSFKLVPRSVKRIVNTFKIMKIVWYLKNEDITPGVTSHSLLLLAMASSEKTRDGTQKLFNMMEENKKPLSKASNLQELIEELCADSNVKINIPFLDSYKIGTDEEWNEVSRTFQMTRSFCFFRTMDIDT